MIRERNWRINAIYVMQGAKRKSNGKSKPSENPSRVSPVTRHSARTDRWNGIRPIRCRGRGSGKLFEGLGDAYTTCTRDRRRTGKVSIADVDILIIRRRKEGFFSKSFYIRPQRTDVSDSEPSRAKKGSPSRKFHFPSFTQKVESLVSSKSGQTHSKQPTPTGARPRVP